MDLEEGCKGDVAKERFTVSWSATKPMSAVARDNIRAERIVSRERKSRYKAVNER